MIIGGEVLSAEGKCAAAGSHHAEVRSSGHLPGPSTGEGESDEQPANAAVDAEIAESWTFGRRLRRARMAKQWSQHQLAHRMIEVGAKHRGSARLGSLLIMVSKWENGRKVPTQYNRHLLAATLEISVEDLGLDVDPDFVF
jgi:ribosome-binding protein aMBF1 (putative translation factor)